MRHVFLGFAAAGLSAIAAPVLAQEMQSPSSSMSHMTCPADAQFMTAMDKMNQAMTTVPMTGNTDHDFVLMMEPHHMSAVTMARTELKYGKDLTLRKMARDIISSQNKEISEMRAWQASHPTTK